jgi:tetratricopeptide (TPR) repeat protein
VLIQVYAELLLLSRELRRGQNTRHRQRLDELARSPNACIVQNVAFVLADAAYRAGDFDGALAHASAAAAGPTLLFKQTARWTLARIHLAQARPEQALAVIDGALSAGSRGAYPHFTVDFLNCRALALSALGQPRAAYQSLRRAARFVADVAGTINAPTLRASYLENVHAHQTMRALAAQWREHAGGDPL